MHGFGRNHECIWRNKHYLFIHYAAGKLASFPRLRQSADFMYLTFMLLKDL